MKQKQPVRVGRRLAAIVAADVAGYSRLMGLDEVGTARTLREHRKVTDALVAKHGGRIVKTTGDGVLLEFPSVVDAVECAVAVQAVMAQRNEIVPQDRRMLFRIGVNLGDILIEGDDILGDGVNVAVRLEGIAEPGGICISSSAHDQVSGKVAVKFTDLGEQTLKNIDRPIRAYAVVRNGAIPQAYSGAATLTHRSAPRLSIVVLPFANIGGDPEQEYFVDGVTESLTTDLSRINGALVIARNTAFTFKGKAVDVKRLGRELNVRYVLEGSVQRGGNRLRVNVQLIDAETGNHLWSERFDEPVADLFDMQDEIVSRLANSLDSELVVAEARRAERSPKPDVMDLVFQGRAWFNKGGTPDHMAKARGFFQQAISLDPANTEAMVMLAFVDATVGGLVMTDDVSGRLAAAEATLTKVFSLEQSRPNHALAHVVQGIIQMFTKRADQAIAECEYALRLDRNLAHAHAIIGFAKVQLGRGEETEAHIKEAFRLSPRDPYAATWCMTVAASKADHSEAIAWLRRGLEANRTIAVAHFLLASRLARIGELEQARAAVQTGLALDPNFTIRRYQIAASASHDHPTVVAARERGIDGMRLAGVPEG
jgi:TolB-like protein/class 3 adenylate cyclase/cytochrome c-type biogenesis protein CcmH/NrfG